MTTPLRLTDAGRAAILDPANVGTQAVQITKVALGAGSGPGGEADDARITLRDQRDIEDVVGSNTVAGQIALRAEFNTATAYPVTELGLFAQIEANPEFLLAYWSDGGTVFINKPADLRTLVAATIAIVRSAADVAVTIAPDITIGTVGAFDDLSDTPASKVNAAGHKVVVRADGAALEYVEGLAAHEVATDAESRAGVLRTKAVPPAGLKAVLEDLVDSAPGALDTLNELAGALGDDPNFSVTIMGLINARPTQAVADARYLRKTGDTATGALRGPHPPDDDNSDQFATTGWMRDFFGGASSREFAGGGGGGVHGTDRIDR